MRARRQDKHAITLPAKELRERFLKTLGAPTSKDAMQMALQTMLEGYEKAVATLPPNSLAREMVAAAFGKAPEISRKVLEIA